MIGALGVTYAPGEAVIVGEAEGVTDASVYEDAVADFSASGVSDGSVNGLATALSAASLANLQPPVAILVEATIIARAISFLDSLYCVWMFIRMIHCTRQVGVIGPQTSIDSSLEKIAEQRQKNKQLKIGKEPGRGSV